MTRADENEEDIDARLARLRDATQNVAPRGNFGERVMAAVEPPRPTGWLFELPSAGRRLIPIAALAAAVAVVWAVRSDGVVDDMLAASYDATELEW